ncbi:hypothetical protein D822_03724, partial [Streptococcus ratti FA-1 = DSM 20564]
QSESQSESHRDPHHSHSTSESGTGKRLPNTGSQEDNLSMLSGLGLLVGAGAIAKLRKEDKE